jgi:hypothetical protein
MIYQNCPLDLNDVGDFFEYSVQGDSSFTARTINPIKTFPSYKASNVCNQFSRITSSRAIKFKKLILTKKIVFRARS